MRVDSLGGRVDGSDFARESSAFDSVPPQGGVEVVQQRARSVLAVLCIVGAVKSIEVN